jgi:putative MATE family efflux protein
MSRYIKNMTTGNEAKLILMFALPLVAGNLFQQLYNIVDSAIVGQFLGYDKLAAVGSTGSITFLFYSICNGLSVGAGILVAQSFGAGLHKEVKKFIVNSAYVLFAVGILISVISTIVAEPVLRFLDTPLTILPDAVSYMQINCIGTVAVAAYNWISAILRSLGDSKTPLIFLIVASILNIILDIIFVLPLNMGVGGAALATVISQGISAVASIIFAIKKNPYFRFSREDFSFSSSHSQRVVKIGLPIALQSGMISISMIFLQKTANAFGETVMAAYTATMKIEQLIHQPFISLNAALSTFTGQNIGAAKLDRVEKGYKKTITMACAFGLFMLCVFFLLSYPIMMIFVSEPSVIEIGSWALRVSCCFYCPLSLIHVTRGLLNGAGDVGFAFINGVAEVIGRIGFALLLVNCTSLGMCSIWLTTCLTWTLTGVMCVLRYKAGIWKKKAEITISSKAIENT